MIRDTSNEAYQRIAPKIGSAQAAVLHTVRQHPEGLTNAEIAHYLGWTINRVTPRCYELREMGLLIDVGRRICRKTHSPAHAYKAKSPVLPPAFEPKQIPPEPEKRSKANQQSLGI
jgi:hypothetical protein